MSAFSFGFSSKAHFLSGREAPGGKMKGRGVELKEMRAVIFVALASVVCGAGISGRILPPQKVRAVYAIKRIPPTMKKFRDQYFKGKFNPQTGEFEVELPTDGRYDLRIETSMGRIEGVDLSVPEEAREAVFDYVVGTKSFRVRNFDTSRYVEEGQVLTKEEKEELAKRHLRFDKLLKRLSSVLKVSRFMDKNIPLYVHGTRHYARVLIMQERERQFYADKGETIWRVEIWDFVWAGDVWDNPRKKKRVLVRERIPTPEYLKKVWVFDPTLGGIEIVGGMDVKEFNYQLPERLDSYMGKTAE